MLLPLVTSPPSELGTEVSDPRISQTLLSKVSLATREKPYLDMRSQSLQRCLFELSRKRALSCRLKVLQDCLPGLIEIVENLLESVRKCIIGVA